MSVPKSTTKVITKRGEISVEYESNVEAAEYYLFELTRAALKDVGRFVCKAFKNEYYKHFNKRTGNAGRATKYRVLSNKNTKYPRVEIGLRTTDNPGFYAYFQEFGTKDKRVPKLGLFQKVVKDNTAEIVKIESQYLSGLSEEAERLAAMVDEGDMEGDADD